LPRAANAIGSPPGDKPQLRPPDPLTTERPALRPAAPQMPARGDSHAPSPRASPRQTSYRARRTRTTDHTQIHPTRAARQ